mmetsp:Transcript_37608/g.87946  ORF Transcript_37608/g.87946 Transcript_37608/m.87946 type:complete len:216 (-) Transcript_37608:161-808(-)
MASRPISRALYCASSSFCSSTRKSFSISYTLGLDAGPVCAACLRNFCSRAANARAARLTHVRHDFFAAAGSSTPWSSFFSRPTPVKNWCTSCTLTSARGSSHASISVHSASSRYEATPLAGAPANSCRVCSISNGKPKKARCKAHCLSALSSPPLSDNACSDSALSSVRRSCSAQSLVAKWRSSACSASATASLAACLRSSPTCASSESRSLIVA